MRTRGGRGAIFNNSPGSTRNTNPITITSEEGLAKEVARITNLSMASGYKLEDEKRVLTRGEAYQQLGHSASLFKAILEYVSGGTKPEK